MYIFMCTNIDACIYVHLYMYTFVHILVHMYMYIYISRYIVDKLLCRAGERFEKIRGWMPMRHAQRSVFMHSEKDTSTYSPTYIHTGMHPPMHQHFQSQSSMR